MVKKVKISTIIVIGFQDGKKRRSGIGEFETRTGETLLDDKGEIKKKCDIYDMITCIKYYDYFLYYY